MHFLITLIIFCGFVFVFCLGLVDVTLGLSEMSVHVSPHGTSRADEGLANATTPYEANATELGETE